MNLDYKFVFFERIKTHRMGFLRIVLLWAPLWLCAQSRVAYEVRHLSTQDGLPDNRVYACVQDSEGFIWFCTQLGVARFDGRNFEQFNVGNGMVDNEILNAFEDGQKRLWFNAFNGRLSYYDLRADSLVTPRDRAFLKELSSSTYLVGAFEDKQGNQWFFSELRQLKSLRRDGSVLSFAGLENFGLFAYPDSLGRVVAIGQNINIFNDSTRQFNVAGTFRSTIRRPFLRTEINHGRLFVDLGDGIWQFWQDGSSRRVIGAEQFKNEKIYLLQCDHKNRIWLGTSSGAYCFDLGNGQLVSQIKTGHTVSKVMFDRDQNLWVTTIGGGVFLYPNNYDRISTSKSFKQLPSQAIQSLTVAPKGDLIFADNLGNVYRHAPHSGLSTLLKVQNGNFAKTMAAIGDDLYMISVGVNGQRLSYVPSILKKTTPQYLRLPSTGEIILRFIGQERPLQEIFNAILPCKNIHFSKSGAIYVAAAYLLKITPLANGKAVTHMIYNRTRSRFFGIGEDENGRIWFGGTEGVVRYDPNNRNDSLHFFNDLISATVNDVMPLSGGHTLLATSGAGLFLLKNDQIVAQWKEKNGISSDVCTKIVAQDDQNVWIATNKGVTRLEFLNGNFTNPYIRIYGQRELTQSQMINDLAIANGNVYIATEDGLYVFNINVLQASKSRPLLKLVGPAHLKSNAKLNLRYGFTWNDNTLDFTFKTVAATSADAITYRYRLLRNNVIERVDTVQTRNDFNLPLNSLAAGDYTLIVQSHTGDGNWSEPITVFFTVHAPILNSGSAWIFYGILILIGVLLFNRQRTRARQRRQAAEMAREKERLRLKTEAAVAQVRLLEMEQEAIRARIDPHFVFNCLNGILSFAYKKDVNAIKVHLPRLARFIRTSLNLGKQDFISVEAEARYLKDYLALETMRFEEKFNFSVSVAPEIAESAAFRAPLLPPLLLQIFVENALKHGIPSLTEGVKGDVNVSFSRQNDQLLCVISDNGAGIDATQKQKQSPADDDETRDESMGLTLAKRRIELLNRIHHRPYVLHIDTCAGATVRLWVPLNGDTEVHSA